MNQKTGNFLKSFLPTLIAIGVQNGAALIAAALGVAVVFHFYKGTTYASFLAALKKESFLSGVNLATYFIYTAICIIGFGIFYYHKFYKKNHENKETVIEKGRNLSVSLKGYSVLVIVGLLLIVLGMQSVCSYLVQCLGTLFPSWLAELEMLEKASGVDATSGAMLLYVVILGPICEELTFRGLTMEYAKRSLKFWPANILQAALFGFMHMNPMQASYAFLLGLLLGYLYFKSGNLLLTIVIHMAFNGVSLYWDTVMNTLFHSKMGMFTFFGTLLVSLMAVYGGVLFVTRGLPEKGIPDGESEKAD